MNNIESSSCFQLKRQAQADDASRFPSLSSCCARWLLGAENELAAFLVAVGQIYGETARDRAAVYWIEKLYSVEISPAIASPDWRQISISAAAQLASETALVSHDAIRNKVCA